MSPLILVCTCGTLCMCPALSYMCPALSCMCPALSCMCPALARDGPLPHTRTRAHAHTHRAAHRRTPWGAMGGNACESLACSALRKVSGHSAGSRSWGRPDSTISLGSGLPPHTLRHDCVRWVDAPPLGTLLCSLCQRSSCTAQLACGGRCAPRRPVRHTPATIPRLRSHKPQGTTGEGRGGSMSGYQAS